MINKRINITKCNKLAAMFGLDARIALAIFGALSVITGAALYKAIEDAKVVQIMTNLEESAKAIEAYYLDTGIILPVSKDPAAISPRDRKTEELLESTVSGWKGPYLPCSKGSHDYVISCKFNIFVQKLETVGGATTSSGTVCSSGKDCFLWIKSHIGNEAFAKKLDKKVDGVEGLDSGKIRINWFGGNKADPIIFYQVMPVSN